LHQAIARDQSGELGRLLKLWYEVPHTQHASLIESVLFHWTGVAQQGSGNPRLLSDQRILSALEAFAGQLHRNGYDIVNNESASIVDREFKQICLYVTGLLNSHPHFSEILSKVRMTWDREANRVIWNVESLLQHLREQVESKLTANHLINLQHAIQSLGDTGSDLLEVLQKKIRSSGRDGDLKLRWLVDKQVVVGSDESEVLQPGLPFSNTIHGGGGNDHIKTHQAADLLDGGDGDDILDGDLGDDIYLFRKSFGQDRIHEAETFGRGFDTAIFADHASTDVEAVEQKNGDLILRFRSGDACTVARYATDAFLYERVDLFRFADGVEWRRPQIMARIHRSQASAGDDILAGQSNTANQIYGLAGNDLIWGGNLDDHLNGDLGHDYLFGGEGDDWLRGGKGRDLLNGGGGRDHYLFARVDGSDTIQAKSTADPGDFGTIIFDAGVVVSKASVSRDPHSNSLLLKSGVLGDQIRIEEFFLDNTPYNARNPIASVRFSDGTHWNTWDLLQLAMRGTAQSDSIWGSVHDDALHGYGGNDYLWGSAGNDQLHGNEGDDLLDGEADNDILYGGLGNNRYRFDRGHGQDIIAAELAPNPGQRSGRIIFDASIHPEAVTFQRQGEQLLITSATSSDSISVQGFFRDNTPANPWNPIHNLEFSASNQSLTTQDILSRLRNGRNGTASNDSLEAPTNGSYLHGFDGDDTLIGSAGDDLLDGGAGFDTASYALAPQGVVVALSLLTPQNTRGAGMDTLTSIEHLVGSRFADHLSGSDDANHLLGGDGDDILVGSTGADRHQGGAGADLFLYRSAEEVGHGVRARDRILDFEAEDRLDLRLIDADLSRAGDQSFVWIGEREFSAPGQLRYSVVNGQGLLKGNLSGSTSPEFTLVLEGGFRLDPSIHLLL
ncbi:MAG: calcium-binding protein, partial [Cyanobium sp.]